jgi:PAS domain S-box-containing protein
MIRVATPRRPRRSAISLLPAALQPFSRRIPLLLTLLLSGVIGSMLWLAHDRVHGSVVGAELARLQFSANQLASALQASAQTPLRDAARVAALPALIQVVKPAATVADRNAAQRVLEDERRRTPRTAAIAVFDAARRLVLVDGNREEAERAGAGVSTAPGHEIGPFAATADTVSYAIASPVIGSFGKVIGTLIVVRRLSTTGDAAALYGGLVGRGARILLGNASGSLWTDLAKPVLGPTVAPKPGAGVEYRDASGTDHLAGAAAVPETPWFVLVEVPRRAATAAASEFVVQMLIIAALFIVGAALASWYLIRRSMRPLDEVAAAAADLANGDYARRVQVTSHDEIGRLGESFNVMAAKVEGAAIEIASRAKALQSANHDLNESELRYRGLFEHLPDGILVHRDSQIVFANPASLRLLGVTSTSEVVGRSVLDLVSAADRAVVAGRLERITRDGIALPSAEMKLRRADKKQVVIEATSMPLMIDGVRAVQTIMHDVTERRLLEEQLRQSQKMDAVGRLAGGIAHDFNNLLTVIGAHAEFALSGSESLEAMRADVEEIRRATDSAARLTRQLLTFSRKQVLTPSHIDLNEALAGTLGMLKRLIGDDVEVVTVARENLAGIWADPGQIEQVLLNLAVNARDAMPDGGVLRFETANVTIGEGYDGASGSVIPAGAYVMLAVQDTGVGMSEEVRTRVFEPFFTTKQPGRGTGLGLSTVYGIVRQSHGHIWVYSEIGRGTTFKVYFPPHREQRARPSLTAIAEHRVPQVAVHVLVVEDEPSVRAAVRRTLTTAGFTVTEAQNAARAMEILSEDRTVNLMITDMIMPGKSGADLVAEVGISHPALPIVIMSGYSEESANKEWRVPDNAVFVEKPASPQELVARIRELLARLSD